MVVLLVKIVLVYLIGALLTFFSGQVLCRLEGDQTNEELEVIVLIAVVCPLLALLIPFTALVYFKL